MSLALDYIKKYPKLDFDRHIDGSVPPGIIQDIALRSGLQKFHLRTGKVIDVDDENVFKEFYQIHTVFSFDELLSRFDFILAVMQTPEQIEEIFYEATCDVARKNIWYVEWTMAPAYHTRGDLGYKEILTSALRGIELGRNKTGVIGKLIPAIQREAIKCEKPEDLRDPTGSNLIDAILELEDPGIVAIGLVCNEALYPPDLYRESFFKTFGSAVKRSIHAGELGKQRRQNVLIALQDLKAESVVHGVPVGSDDELMRLMIEKGARHVLHPWSNILTGAIESIEELHIDTLLDRGVLSSVHSDDPILFERELADNLFLVLDYYNWGKEELTLLTQNALNTAFVGGHEREMLFRRFRELGAAV